MVTTIVSSQKVSRNASPAFPWPIPPAGFSVEVAVVERTRPARESHYVVSIDLVPFRPNSFEVSGYVLTKYADGGRITAGRVACGNVCFATNQPSEAFTNEFQWLVAYMREMSTRAAEFEEKARQKGAFR